MNKNSVPESAMVIVAHPDDAEFVMAGTVAAWTKAGCHVVYVICTDGNAGSQEPGMTRKKLARLRRKEQRAACATLGVRQVIFLGYEDGQLEPTLELRRDLVRVIRQHKPNIVLAIDPTVMFFGDDYINHPDHRASGQAALDAVAPACAMPLLWPELGQPHRVRQVYLHTNEKFNTWIDISETIECKVAALKQHASQMGDWDPDKEMREWGAQSGQEKGLAYAERFRVITLEHGEKSDAKEES